MSRRKLKWIIIFILCAAVICVAYEIQDGSYSAEYFLLDENGEELR